MTTIWFIVWAFSQVDRDWQLWLSIALMVDFLLALAIVSD